jgi:hypothetical protein
MSQSRLLLLWAAVGALICGIIVALLMGISFIGTGVVIPSLGIYVAGPFGAAVLGGLIGGLIGSVLGLIVGVVIILVRR